MCSMTFGPATVPAGGGSRAIAVSSFAGATLDGTRLVIVGTSSSDDIKVHPGGGPQGIKVMMNGVQSTFTGVTEIVIFGNDGDDLIRVVGGITLPVFAFGGAGNDSISGGGGLNVLMGGDGDDLLVGGDGRNILIGGNGADRIQGGGADDLLISGSTAFDFNFTALHLIQTEWSSASSFADRVHHLDGTLSGGLNGSVKLLVSGVDATVFDDNSVDVLTGNGGNDWFLFNRSGSGVLDKAMDMSAFEGLYAEDLSRFGPYVG